MSYTKRKCDYCNTEYLADNRNLKRGFGLCCSKKCASNKREKVNLIIILNVLKEIIIVEKIGMIYGQ